MRKKHLIVCLLSMSILFSAHFKANAETNSQLRSLNNKITSMQTALHKAQLQRTQLQSQLRQTEINSGQLAKRIHADKLALRKQQRQLTRLQTQQTNLNNSVQTQRENLANQLRSLYLLGNQPYLKLLLDQKNSSRIDRIKVYYSYISETVDNTIKQLQGTLAQLQLNQQKLQQQHLRLQTLTQTLLAQQQSYQALNNKRQKLIRNIDGHIHSRRQKLALLIQNKERFEQTLSQLSHNEAMENNQYHNFRQLFGRLGWPTQGKIVNMFGQKIQGSQLSWAGVLIKAHENQPIYAVADGTVAFSKWLPGYGLLLIINHGNGYMTLYGRTHSIYKAIGEPVHAGDLIATVGKSGGFNKSALYFAIRHNAKPLNPMHWCGKHRYH